MAVDTEGARPNRSARWWKIAFFLMLFLFEGAREVAVLSAFETAEPSVIKSIFGGPDYVIARGRWLRSDGGSPIMPMAVTIECDRERGQCVEANVNSGGRHFFAPEIDWFDARFTSTSVSYVNDMADCARYAVQIDLTTERAFATRVRKPTPTNEMCKKMEERVAMELGEGYVSNPDPLKGHVVPLFSLLGGVISLFSGSTDV